MRKSKNNMKSRKAKTHLESFSSRIGYAGLRKKNQVRKRETLQVNAR